jgi:RNA polymerase sigma-70 factor (ECF subfamily)
MGGERRSEASETERFMALYSSHHRQLYLYTVTLLCGSADSEDVLQEANLVLWQKFHQYQEGTNFFAWACCIIRYKAMEYCRNRRKGPRAARLLDPDVLDHWADLAAEQIDHFDESYHRTLIDCMGRLSPGDQDLMRQRYAEAMPVQAMAAALDRSPNAISQSLGRVRQLLFDCISSKLGGADHDGNEP